MDAVEGVPATKKKLVAAFRGIVGPARGVAADVGAASATAAAILSGRTPPITAPPRWPRQ